MTRLFILLAFGGSICIGIGLWLGYARGGGSSDGFAIAAVVAFFGLIGLTTLVWYLVDENVVRPLLALAAGLRTRASSAVMSKEGVEASGYLHELEGASRVVGEALDEARATLDRALAEKTAIIERDKSLLEALLRELADGVVVVSPDRRILLYNRVAITLLGPLGLDRPLDRYLRIEPVNSAIERQLGGGKTEPAVFLTSSVAGDLMLTGTVTPVDLGKDRAGFVVHFRDMTEDLRVHGELERLLQRTIEGARRPASAMGAVLEVLESVPEMDGEDRARFDASLREELAHLTRMLEDSSAKEQALSAGHWPIRELHVQQIFDALVQRIEGQLLVEQSDAIVCCDGFAITETLFRVIEALTPRPERHGFTLSAEEAHDGVRLFLTWQGPSLALGELEEWLSQPIATAYGAYTGRDALDAHRSEIWVEPVEGGARIVVPLPSGEGANERPRSRSPLQFYDFRLPTFSDPELGPRLLGDLVFTIFDTETTGLDPDRDDVVQISGVRIVGRRILADEVFDRLVNPGRPIPPSSTEIHRISDDMVIDAPAFETVGEDFLRFAEGSVLVAHHAAFDTAFLQRHKRDLGQGFSVPILCTALLSSRLFAHSSDHTLDGLAARCGVEIEAELRHTALGDSLATAEIFLKLMPLLESEGVRTLNDALSWQRRRL